MGKREDKTAAEFGRQGGEQRAKNLSRDQRRDIARLAAEARWERTGKSKMPRALRTGPLKIAGIEFDCAVLDDEQHTRVVSETRFMAAMGMYRSGALSTRRSRSEDGAREPLFLAYKNLKPYIDKHLGGVHFSPIQYRTLEGGVVNVGIAAELIPKICEVWIDADRDGVLGKNQKLVAAKADVLFRGFAHVGIIALVDEATVWQDDRARDALAKILEAFVAKEIQPWVSTFPPEFYKEMCRLKGIPYTGSLKRPKYFGHLTNNLVYKRLAPGVLKELRERNPVTETGRRKSTHHQWLTPTVGHPKLQHHLGKVTGLMLISQDWGGLEKLLDKHVPIYKHYPLLDGPIT